MGGRKSGIGRGRGSLRYVLKEMKTLCFIVGYFCGIDMSEVGIIMAARRSFCCKELSAKG